MERSGAASTPVTGRSWGSGVAGATPSNAGVGSEVEASLVKVGDVGVGSTGVSFTLGGNTPEGGEPSPLNLSLKLGVAAGVLKPPLPNSNCVGTPSIVGGSTPGSTPVKRSLKLGVPPSA